MITLISRKRYVASSFGAFSGGSGLPCTCKCSECRHKTLVLLMHRVLQCSLCRLLLAAFGFVSVTAALRYGAAPVGQSSRSTEFQLVRCCSSSARKDAFNADVRPSQLHSIAASPVNFGSNPALPRSADSAVRPGAQSGAGNPHRIAGGERGSASAAERHTGCQGSPAMLFLSSLPSSVRRAAFSFLLAHHTSATIDHEREAQAPALAWQRHGRRLECRQCYREAEEARCAHVEPARVSHSCVVSCRIVTDSSATATRARRSSTATSSSGRSAPVSPTSAISCSRPPSLRRTATILSACRSLPRRTRRSFATKRSVAAFSSCRCFILTFRTAGPPFCPDQDTLLDRLHVQHGRRRAGNGAFTGGAVVNAGASLTVSAALFDLDASRTR